MAPPDVWTDIPPVHSQADERTGYPTQKPLALLDRITRASSKPGDLVLTRSADALPPSSWRTVSGASGPHRPFAPGYQAGQRPDHRGSWQSGMAPLPGGVIALDRPPKRTDLGIIPPYRTNASLSVSLRQADRQLRRLWLSLSVQRSDRRSHSALLARRRRPPGQPATAVPRLQLQQAQPQHTRMARRTVSRRQGAPHDL